MDTSNKRACFAARSVAPGRWCIHLANWAACEEESGAEAGNLETSFREEPGQTYTDGMQCDECGKPANVHEIRVENGMKTERHLCSECAAKAGLTANEPQMDAPTNPVEMIKQVLAAGPEIEVRAAPECPTCGSTFARFRKMALLGCPDCYQALQVPLQPLILRSQAAEARELPEHQGLRPSNYKSPAQPTKTLIRLERELQGAIHAEQYERAADLRDKIRKLSEGAEPLDQAE
ncbi:MAG: hypothetical protein CMJ30_04430 [Phycisphaerae bacterium]|jgi:protein arginine kinase activator|nr:hypothetical protein [Phycisphaerae bacterium]